jgi:hypothetical protein
MKKKRKQQPRPRKTWRVNPVTRVKPSAKVYSRKPSRKQEGPYEE